MYRWRTVNPVALITLRSSRDHEPFNVAVPALRVSQLDASELDAQMVNHLVTSFQDIVRYWPASAACVSLHLNWLRVVAKVSVAAVLLHRQGATYGMDLLGLCYARCVSSQPQLVLTGQLSLGRRVLMLAGMLLQAAQEALLSDGIARASSLTWTRVLATAGALAQLLSSVAFLQRGMFQCWWERLLSVRKVYQRTQGAGAKPPTFEFTERELMWHNAAELLSALFPLGRHVLRHCRGLLDGFAAGRSSCVSGCPVCAAERPQLPVCPPGLCAHPACYYCVASKLAREHCYRCAVCGCEAANHEELRHYCCFKK